MSEGPASFVVVVGSAAMPAIDDNPGHSALHPPYTVDGAIAKKGADGFTVQEEEEEEDEHEAQLLRRLCSQILGSDDDTTAADPAPPLQRVALPAHRSSHEDDAALRLSAFGLSLSSLGGPASSCGASSVPTALSEASHTSCSAASDPRHAAGAAAAVLRGHSAAAAAPAAAAAACCNAAATTTSAEAAVGDGRGLCGGEGVERLNGPAAIGATPTATTPPVRLTPVLPVLPVYPILAPMQCTAPTPAPVSSPLAAAVAPVRIGAASPTTVATTIHNCNNGGAGSRERIGATRSHHHHHHHHHQQGRPSSMNPLPPQERQRQHHRQQQRGRQMVQNHGVSHETAPFPWVAGLTTASSGIDATSAMSPLPLSAHFVSPSVGAATAAASTSVSYSSGSSNGSSTQHVGGGVRQFSHQELLHFAALQQQYALLTGQR